MRFDVTENVRIEKKINDFTDYKTWMMAAVEKIPRS